MIFYITRDGWTILLTPLPSKLFTGDGSNDVENLLIGSRGGAQSTLFTRMPFETNIRGSGVLFKNHSFELVIRIPRALQRVTQGRD